MRRNTSPGRAFVWNKWRRCAEALASSPAQSWQNRIAPGRRPALRRNSRRTDMRILALDHGTKRVGVAISDELKMIAQPLEFLPAEPFSKFITRVEQLLTDKEVELIIVGMPRNMNGRSEEHTSE